MPRTTPAQVALIAEIDPDVDLEAFITTANELVTECCADVGYTDVRLELIERWLAAHFYHIRDLRNASETAGPVGESKQYRIGLVLASTQYGQQAMVLDTKGGLARLSKDIEAGRRLRNPSVVWLGTKCP